MKRRAPKRKPVHTTRGAKTGMKADATPPRGRRSAIKASANDPTDTLIDGAARALGLLIDPAWRDGVRFHLRLVLTHAARVDEFKLPDDAEPAPVFHA